MMRIRTYSRADILQKFHAHCQSLADNDNAGYRREFEEMDDTGQGYSCRAGELDANKDKNRYPFILPYDHCRVKLSLLESQPHSDYINASFVPGGCSEQDFICTQAPLRSTMADFWRMVWEQNVQVIVMVTALRERGKIMCNQYWPPERGTGCYGAVQVTTISCQRGPEYYITTLHLRQHGCATERRVIHYLYPGWPDQGVPKDPISLCAFTEHVRKYLDNAPRLRPAVVHCSAGVGRSGSFVALLWLMQLCVRGIPPDVRLAVEDLRKRRVLMVQNLEQYILVHQCLFHWLGGDVFKPSTQNAHLPPRTSQSQRTRQSKRERRSQSRPPTTHQPESKRSSDQAPHRNPPQRRGWRAIQTTLQTFSPSKLLQRILPTSSQHTPQDTAHNQL
ncbi:receptor-type tyrosine-protein phosphatase V-like [Astyanax mexicanus]|uniref:protein-tyrosine-phosphatase n=1 Tax=Astyanax mexicanus TaxID=7994 RepID=A0A8T2LJX7_ASTMX|nr:receptor-type tyrosine-protein phosphatase V-like [Astyanax mexicanus]